MADQDATAAIAQAAVDSQVESAQAHKRAAGFHRRQAREAMQRAERFVSELRARGIEVTFTTTGGAGDGHGPTA